MEQRSSASAPRLLCAHVLVTLLSAVAMATTDNYKMLNESDYGCLVGDLPGDDYASIPAIKPVPRQVGLVEAVTASATSPEWKPARFKVFTKDLDDPRKYCTEVGQIRSSFSLGNVRCTEEDVFTSAKKTILLNHNIPLGIKKHADRLSVQPITGVIKVAEFRSLTCREFTVPAEHRITGLTDVDTVFYAAAAPVRGFSAWAVICATHDGGRPLVGAFNIGPPSIAATLRAVNLVAHELAHALGFHDKVISARNMSRYVQDVRGKRLVRVVNTPKVVEAARRHFKCDSLHGMELEDEGSSGTVGSHWKRRNAMDDLMCGVQGTMGSFYSTLTMAFFEDSGFYKVSWGTEEPMGWGYGAGCSFLEKKCVENDTSNFPEWFCDSITPERQKLCTADRRGLGKCQMAKFKEELPAHLQYFTNRSQGGGRSLMDCCPLVVAHSRTMCADGTARILPGSRLGSTSRCVKGEGLLPGSASHPVGDICVEICCRLPTLGVRFAGDNTWYQCPAGERLAPRKGFKGGHIICPTRSQVCPRDSRDIFPIGGDVSQLIPHVDPPSIKTCLSATGSFESPEDCANTRVIPSDLQADLLTCPSSRSRTMLNVVPTACLSNIGCTIILTRFMLLARPALWGDL
ncbi:putative Leishmanolysin [Trypanosoma vivax]|uniref:Leishmanolysin-like peptidase n=1 Tax=Trypanosoma vivax (strain Y486) TaxID=1055687 RepID=G0UC84_TRYVY|nr:putative p63-1 surface protease [Trypanosoma vivax]KAH8609607.1 putative Leishmanolysin [Trypanosoma vivax]CCC53434.1 putative p63-1 surface protease homolog [Trypanosoma vivax Y486]